MAEYFGDFAVSPSTNSRAPSNDPVANQSSGCPRSICLVIIFQMCCPRDSRQRRDEEVMLVESFFQSAIKIYVTYLITTIFLQAILCENNKQYFSFRIHAFRFELISNNDVLFRSLHVITLAHYLMELFLVLVHYRLRLLKCCGFS